MGEDSYRKVTPEITGHIEFEFMCPECYENLQLDMAAMDVLPYWPRMQFECPACCSILELERDEDRS